MNGVLGIAELLAKTNLDTRQNTTVSQRPLPLR
ncbi:hypothetical protein ACC710_37075 [Rhizobium ruizarguesonis]